MDSKREEIGNIHFKTKRKLCENPETCPFCKAGIPRQVTFPMYDMETGQTTMFTMSEQMYKKMMDQKGGEDVS